MEAVCSMTQSSIVQILFNEAALQHGCFMWSKPFFVLLASDVCNVTTCYTRKENIAIRFMVCLKSQKCYTNVRCSHNYGKWVSKTHASFFFKDMKKGVPDSSELQSVKMLLQMICSWSTFPFESNDSRSLLLYLNTFCMLFAIRCTCT